MCEKHPKKKCKAIQLYINNNLFLREKYLIDSPNRLTAGGVPPLSDLNLGILAGGSVGLQDQADGLLSVITGAQVKYAHCWEDFSVANNLTAQVEWLLWRPNVLMQGDPLRGHIFLL